jgi:general secretion pathway protein D
MKQVCHALVALLASLTILGTSSSIAESINTKTTTITKQTTAAKVKPTKPAGRLWNLQDADILSVINEVSLETGKNFVVDPRVSGKISLISSKPVNPNEVYQVFLSVLELLGYSAVPSGDVVKIVPNMESGELASKVATTNSPGRGDEVVVRVIPLENVSATQILPVLRPMLPQWSNISAYMPGNVLILAGHAANLQRIVNVIQNIDSSATNSIEIVPLRQASASQVATVLTNLQNAARNNGDNASISIASDERSNSILLSGNKNARLRLRALISQLDAPVSGSQGNTEVIYLRYLQAKTLAPVLGKIANNILRTGNTESGGVSQAAAGNVANGSNTQAKKDIPENETNIQAEPNVNALIVTAPPALMKSIKSIVAKLDIRPAQVLVQAIIVELDESDLNNLGIQWGARNSTNPNENGQGGQSGASNSVAFPPLGEGTLGIIPSTQVKAILSALQNTTGANILSTPSVVVLDNRKATLKVGQDVPFTTGSYATTGGNNTVTPFSTTESKPVVLQLDVTPQINLGSSVRLKIMLKNDTLQNPDNPGPTPLINTSQIQNSVIIKSDDVLVIGGLISNNLTESTDKIPILGDIPIAGILFQHKSHTIQRRKLVAFIKPIIMYNEEDALAITNTKYNAIRQAQMDWPSDLTHVGNQKRQNILPLWNNNVALPKPFESS